MMPTLKEAKTKGGMQRGGKTYWFSLIAYHHQQPIRDLLARMHSDYVFQKKKKKIESRTQQYLKADKAWVWIHIKDYANIKSSGWSAGVGFCVCI